jgi:two-component system response regulator MprA
MAILIVDDDQAVRDALRRALGLQGYEVEIARDGEEGLLKLRSNPNAVDLLIVDILMPRLDGLEMTRRLRLDGNAGPILMLTARDEVSDRVAGLEAGADDYLVKPFALEELVARVRALLRRLGADEAASTLTFDDLELNTGTREVRRGDESLVLTRTEFALLELFMRNPRQVLTRSVIFDRVWGYDFGYGSNSLDVYISYLRKKTEAGGKPRLIHTVRGVGYALRER